MNGIALVPCTIAAHLSFCTAVAICIMDNIKYGKSAEKICEDVARIQRPGL